jgi:hypothetical protein
MATRKKPGADVAAKAASVVATTGAQSKKVALTILFVEPGAANDVCVIRCVDEVAAAELLSFPDIATTILGRLDNTHLLVDREKKRLLSRRLANTT